MSERRNNFAYVFLPMMVIFIVQNVLSIFSAQIYMCYVILQNMPLTVDELLDIVTEGIRSPKVYLAFSVFTNSVITIIFAAWYRRLRRQEKGKKEEVVLKKPFLPNLALGIVLVAVGSQFALSFVVEIISVISPSWVLDYMSAMDTIGLNVNGEQSPTLLLFIYTVVLAPFLEELGFRGITVLYGIRATSFWATAISSAVLFGAFHGNALQAIYGFIFGIILAYIALKTGKVWITIIIHMIFNGMALFTPWIITTGSHPIQTFVIALTALVAVYLGLTLLSREYNKS